MKLITVGFTMFGNQLTLWNLLKIVMSELYKRFLGVEPANKLKRLKKNKIKNKKIKTFFLNFFFFLILKKRTFSWLGKCQTH